jgi:hypothetical protein
MLNFWSKLVNGKNDKICASLYRTMYNLHEKGILHCQWIEKVKSNLNDMFVLILDNSECYKL